MEPLILVIFGASGDLAKRKLIPAVYQLYKGQFLPDCFAVLGVSRTKYSDESFRSFIFENNEHLEHGSISAEDQQKFAEKLFYLPISTKEQADYGKVKERLKELDAQCHTQGNYMFYLSTPPSLYQIIPASLAYHGLNDESDGWKRLVVEKPFGYDQQSATELNNGLQAHFDEDQIYRIDHYLGKETVQNLLVTRFANGIFEPLWNRNYIEKVEITSAESIGVGSRGGYYDTSGALRDMFQNHLLQVVAHVAMEPPTKADAESIRNEKLKLFRSIRPITEAEVGEYVIRGQYIGSTMSGEEVIGYREAEGVPENSKTETYVAVKFFIDNWRWADVPFFVRTGKCLPTKVTEVVVHFKAPPHGLFREEEEFDANNNKLIIRIQPQEGLVLNFGMKIPGQGFRVKDVNMDFHYSDLVDTYVPEAYERLLLDGMRGDATLYARGDSVEAAWAFVDPIIEAWKKDDTIKLFGYPAGTWGPVEADVLMGEEWHNPCSKLTEDTNFCEL
ncbi:MAG: glucose-6-phosphate dehydrogenase [Bacteroidota bacterium]